MRVRVLGPLLLCLLLAVIALVVPALEATSRDRTQQLVLNRSASLDRLAALAVIALEQGNLDTLEQHAIRYVELYGEPIVIVDASSTPVLTVGDLDPEDQTLKTVAAQATRNLPRKDIPTVRPWSSRYHLIARPINGAGDATGAVVVRVDAQDARSDVRLQWFLILAGATAVVLFLIALALALTRWVLRPVRRLDDAATALAAGERPGDLLLSGPPELRRLASSFDVMADTVTTTLDQQRRLVADSSHQLRNPLAAIRLRIDSLEGQSGTDATLTEVGADLDRLEHIVDKLLLLAEAEHRASSQGASATMLTDDSHAGPETTDLFVSEVVARWQPVLDAADVRLVVLGEAHIGVQCPGADLHDMIDALIDNAAKYAGAGSTVTIEVAHRGDQVSITVSDDGPGLPETEISLAGQRFWRSARDSGERGSGLGLAIVAQLARANGGSVAIEAATPHGLQVEIRLGYVDG